MFVLNRFSTAVVVAVWIAVLFLPPDEPGFEQLGRSLLSSSSPQPALNSDCRQGSKSPSFQSIYCTETLWERACVEVQVVPRARLDVVASRCATIAKRNSFASHRWVGRCVLRRKGEISNVVGMWNDIIK